MLIAALLVATAVISSLFRALTPFAIRYKKEIEQRLSALVGVPVSIQGMQTSWYWFEPVVKFKKIAIEAVDQNSITLDRLFVGIDLWSSFWHWQIRPGVLYAKDAHLNLRQKGNQWQIDGLATTPDTEVTKQMLGWLLAQQKIIIQNLSATVVLDDGQRLPITDINLALANHSGNYSIKGDAKLLQTKPTFFKFLANLNINADSLNSNEGKLFFSLQHVVPSQWQSLLPPSRFLIEAGEGTLEAWASWEKGSLHTLQTYWDFSRLVLHDEQTDKKDSLDIFKANLAWLPTSTGWQLSGDRVQMRLNQVDWPENSFSVAYQRDSDDYSISIKNLFLKSLLAATPRWPTAINSLQKLDPHGRFNDTQIHWKNGEIVYVLTAFTKLGWHPFNGIPGIDNLSGVIHWEPTEGHIEIDGKKSTFSDNINPSLTLDVITTDIDWKTLANGLKISMDRLILKHPELLLTAQGVLDEVNSNSTGQMHLGAQFSAKQAQRWIRYIPSGFLKPNLEAWLKQDVKKIATLTGDLIVDGAINDFPFDKQQGKFTLKTYLAGVDLFFAPHWPLIRDLAGYLTFNKRTLEANIVQGDSAEIHLDNGNLRVDNLGSNQESLLFHTTIKTASEKALSYLFNSPLKKKFAALRLLDLKGPLHCNIQLEVPLYDESDSVLVTGNLSFKKNQILLKSAKADLALEDVNGTLDFDQQGIIGINDLKAQSLGNPVLISLESVYHPEVYTAIKFKTKTSINWLQKAFDLPLFSAMKGSFWFEALLKLPNKTQASQQLHVTTPLIGLQIDLPSPFGKAISDPKLLTLDLDFDASQLTNFHFDFANTVRGALHFSSNNTAQTIERALIQLGGQEVKPKVEQGLQIVGTLPFFDVQQWLTTYTQLVSQNNKNSYPIRLQKVDVQFEKIKWLHETYSDLNVKATPSGQSNWRLQLNQAAFKADLQYNTSQNTLNGEFSKLELPQVSHESESFEKLDLSAKMDALPSFNLRIHSFKVGGFALGELALKTTVTHNHLRLNYAKIINPDFQFEAKADWNQANGKNSTTINANLQLSDLERSLARFGISPVIEAQQGQMYFNGVWPGSLFAFNLADLEGDMTIALKHGRITHLSAETEEKLGLGKLLSILSLQTIPRRLALDFSDLAQGGYSFDKFQGNFKLTQGILSTQDSFIDGPVAHASMKGHLDIIKQLYDLDLKVIPHITASLPVVATIAGGPVAGIATWVASRIINQGMQQISGYTYKISGPWHQPVVQQVSIIH